jgi:hypothetical protein
MLNTSSTQKFIPRTGKKNDQLLAQRNLRNEEKEKKRAEDRLKRHQLRN